jgi:hypothetical protein
MLRIMFPEGILLAGFGRLGLESRAGRAGRSACAYGEARGLVPDLLGNIGLGTEELLCGNLEGIEAVLEQDVFLPRAIRGDVDRVAIQRNRIGAATRAFYGHCRCACGVRILRRECNCERRLADDSGKFKDEIYEDDRADNDRPNIFRRSGFDKSIFRKAIALTGILYIGLEAAPPCFAVEVELFSKPHKVSAKIRGRDISEVAANETFNMRRCDAGHLRKFFEREIFRFDPFGKKLFERDVFRIHTRKFTTVLPLVL